MALLVQRGRGAFRARERPFALKVTSLTADPAAATLLSAAAVRERCRNVADWVSRGRSRWLRVDRERLAACAERVAAVTRKRYPDLRIPYHSRWRHFEAGGVDRRALLPDSAQAQVDLTVASVLLDAGAGASWSYLEHETGKRFTRSEGLGVATLRAFVQGAFSSQRDPFRVDAAALSAMDARKLGDVFQVRDDNPLVGLEARAALLRRLGAALDGQRPSVLIDRLRGASVSAPAILHELLVMLGPIWPHGETLNGVPLGDAWRHSQAGGEGEARGWVPFHKLSQWLSYSLFEPFEWAGVRVTDRDALTALPEYRNGGLLLDSGVLELRDDGAAVVAWEVGSELVVEWRALTVTLIDELAPLVRAKLGVADLPLACILEGGTWAAGRELAAQLRGGEPPLAIKSDGTVF
jgi:hypothetical protein